MSGLGKKRQLVHTPITYVPNAVEAPYVSDFTQTGHNLDQIHRKIDSLGKREDAVYALASRIGQLESQARVQGSSNLIYEQSLRDAQLGADDFYEEEVQSLENEKLMLMRR